MVIYAKELEQVVTANFNLGISSKQFVFLEVAEDEMDNGLKLNAW